MKKCSRCQAENFEDQKFCNLCGRELSARIAYDLYAGNPPSAKAPEPEEKVTPETKAYQHFVKAKDEIAKRNLDGAIAEFKAALAACPGDAMIERLLKKTEDARERAVSGPVRAAETAARSAAGGPRTLKTSPRQAPLVFDAVVAHGDVSASDAISDEAELSAMKRANAAKVAAQTIAEFPARAVMGVDLEGPRQRAPRAGTMNPHAASAHAPHPHPAASANMHASMATPPRARGATPVAAAIASAAKIPRPGKHEAPAAPRSSRRSDADQSSARVAPHTGRFLELYERAPSLSPALALDGRSDEGFREIAVNLLILGGFLIFGFLLLL